MIHINTMMLPRTFIFAQPTADRITSCADYVYTYSELPKMTAGRYFDSADSSYTPRERPNTTADRHYIYNNTHKVSAEGYSDTAAP